MYGNTGPEKFATGPLIIFVSLSLVALKVACTGPLPFSMKAFNGAKDHFEVITYGTMDLYQSLC